MTSTVNANFSDVASKVNSPQQMSLGDMVNMARAAQAYQQAQLTNPLAVREQSARTELAEKTLKPQISAKESEAKRLALEADKTGVDVKNHYANIARGVYGGLLTDPDFQSGNKEKMLEKLEKAKGFLEDVGIPTHESKMHDQLKEMVNKDPKQAFQMIKNGIQQAGTNAEQFSQVNAPANYVNTGQMQVPIYQSPYQGGGPGQTPAIQNVLPPTTPIVNPQGTPGYLGPQNQQQFVQSGLAPGQAQNIEKNVNLAAGDWSQTYQDAQQAQNRIGLLQNIKDLAGKAFTGVGGQRKEFIAGLANAIGIPAFEVEKANTDVLAKNSNLLALAGGNTDLARQIAEAANPNKKMNYDAIKEASNQLIATEKLKAKKAEILAPFKDNPSLFQQKALEFSKVADPRLLQEMTPEQVKSLKQSMSAAERIEFNNKIKEAKRLGLIP